MDSHIQLDESISRPEWMNFLIQDYKKEVIEAANLQFVTAEGRISIWNFCKNIGHYKHGVPGQACQLLERYLSKFLSTKIHTNLESQAVEASMRKLKKDLDIILGCCVLLAIKMFKRMSKLEERRILPIIFNGRYTVQDIILMEAEVFKTLGYYIPSKTTVDVSELLAQEIELSQNVLKHIDLVISLAELNKPSIVKKLRWAANLDETVIICKLHFAAGGVVATAYYVGDYILDPVIPMSRLTGASTVYLKAIASAILSEVAIGHGEKRKRE